MEIGASVTFTRMIAAMKDKIKSRVNPGVFNSLSVIVNHLRRLATTQVVTISWSKKKKNILINVAFCRYEIWVL